MLDGNQPFFCMMRVFDPHNPYEDYPLDMCNRVDENKMPDPLIHKNGGNAKPHVAKNWANVKGEDVNYLHQAMKMEGLAE